MQAEKTGQSVHLCRWGMLPEKRPNNPSKVVLNEKTNQILDLLSVFIVAWLSLLISLLLCKTQIAQTAKYLNKNLENLNFQFFKIPAYLK